VLGLIQVMNLGREPHERVADYAACNDVLSILSLSGCSCGGSLWLID